MLCFISAEFLDAAWQITMLPGFIALVGIVGVACLVFSGKNART